ncbi:MAG: hypothetical protein WBE26_05125 [Phycisphaerae bacterium]
MTATQERNETFEVIDGHLVREVVPRRGEPYEHRCPRTSFEQVAHAIDEAGGEGFTLESLAEHEDLPFTQVAVALAFMKERGIVETRFRRNYAATESVHLDAMTEFCALAENG